MCRHIDNTFSRAALFASTHTGREEAGALRAVVVIGTVRGHTGVPVRLRHFTRDDEVSAVPAPRLCGCRIGACRERRAMFDRECFPGPSDRECRHGE